MSGKHLAVAVIIVAVLGAPAWASIGPIMVSDFGRVQVVYDGGDPVRLFDRPDQNQGPFKTMFESKFTDPDGNKAIEGPAWLFCVQAQNLSAGWKDIDGVDSSNSSNPAQELTSYAAWVYHQFRENVLDWAHEAWEGKDPTIPELPSSVDSWGQAMDYYQAAIWAGITSDDVGGQGSMIVEIGGYTIVGGATTFQGYWWGEDKDTPGETQGLLDLGIAKSQYNASGWEGIGNYRLLHVGGSQDLAILVDASDPLFDTDPIPEPTSVAIWSVIAMAFVCGSSMVRRRRRFVTGGSPRGWNPQNRTAIRQIVERGRQA